MGEYAVEINNVSKMFKLYHENVKSLKEKVMFLNRRGYEEFWALKDVSAQVRYGETFGIIGANGSGKSTLLKCITRILYPTSGEVVTNGSIAALLELGAGFQPDLTGRENIYLNGSILGFSKKEIDRKFDEIVEFSELGRFIDNHVRNYSSGMFIRLGFAIAISVDPDILIIDEVLAVGDEAFQRKCLERISEIQDSGKTIIFVTHNVEITREICSEVIMLEHGRLVKQGKPREVVNYYHEKMETVGGGGERGNRSIEIVDVAFLDEEGVESSHFITGDDLEVRVSYEAHDPVDDPVFGISIEDYRGFTVYGTNTRLKEMRLGTLRGKGTVTFNLKSMPMLEGKYNVSLAIHSRDEETVYHWIDRWGSFEMKSDFPDAGVLYVSTDITTSGEDKVGHERG